MSGTSTLLVIVAIILAAAVGTGFGVMARQAPEGGMPTTNPFANAQLLAIHQDMDLLVALNTKGCAR